MKEVLCGTQGVEVLEREALLTMKDKRQVYEDRITVRLDDELKKFVTSESERLKQPPSSVVRMIVAERMRRGEDYHPNQPREKKS